MNELERELEYLAGRGVPLTDPRIRRKQEELDKLYKKYR